MNSIVKYIVLSADVWTEDRRLLDERAEGARSDGV